MEQICFDKQNNFKCTVNETKTKALSYTFNWQFYTILWLTNVQFSYSIRKCFFLHKYSVDYLLNIQAVSYSKRTERKLIYIHHASPSFTEMPHLDYIAQIVLE